MLGVVLWSDPQERKAVIWCEDHGDLAFYQCEQAPTDSAFAMDAGDLVQFDVDTRQSFRVACNPQLLEGGMFSDLPDVLAETVHKTDPTAAQPGSGPKTADVIPLHQMRMRRNAPAGAVRKTG